MPLEKPYVVGQICARGGSKGIPRKNLRVLGGKPLIAWSIEAALNCLSIDRVIVSTEDPEIREIAQKYGAEVPFVRPMELAGDTSLEWSVWQHTLRTLEALDGRRPDILVNIPPTSPFRSVDDIENCLMSLRNCNADVSITVTPAQRNPYFNMVTLVDGWANIVANAPGDVSRRQDAPEVFDITTVAYAAWSAFILKAGRLFEGRVCASVVPPERALDIDTELDFAFAEFLVKRGCP